MLNAAGATSVVSAVCADLQSSAGRSVSMKMLNAAGATSVVSAVCADLKSSAVRSVSMQMLNAAGATSVVSAVCASRGPGAAAAPSCLPGIPPSWITTPRCAGLLERHLLRRSKQPCRSLRCGCSWSAPS